MEWRTFNVGGCPLVWERPQDTPKVRFRVVSRQDVEQTVGVRHSPGFLYAKKGDPFGALCLQTHKTLEVSKEALVRVSGGLIRIPLGRVIQE